MTTRCFEINQVIGNRVFNVFPVSGSGQSNAMSRGKHLVLLFMPRSTSSRSWQAALALARLQEWLQGHDTALVIVAEDRHFRSASQLAKDLRLPFQVVADLRGALRRCFGLVSAGSGPSEPALVLLSRHGEVCFRQDSQAPGTTLNLAELLATVENLAASDRAPCPRQRVTDPCSTRHQDCCVA